MRPVVTMHNTVQYAETEHYNYWLAALKKLKWGKLKKVKEKTNVTRGCKLLNYSDC